MLRDGLLESWEEALDRAEDPFDTGYMPPAHELNAQQEAALTGIRARFELGAFGVQLLHGVTGSGNIGMSGTGATGERRRTRSRMVARSKRRSPRRRWHALRDFRTA